MRFKKNYVFRFWIQQEAETDIEHDYYYEADKIKII